MNLQQAVQLTELRRPVPIANSKPMVRTANEVARDVFAQAEAGGFPYTGQTSEQWAKKWLKSKKFVLMEIDINAAASPHLPKNPDRVAFKLLCRAEEMLPSVVDLNKRKVGRSLLHYVPEVIFLDGKHRRMAQQLQGKQRILAWVGIKAASKIKNTKIVSNLELPKGNPEPTGTPVGTAFQLHAATSDGTTPAVTRQDAGQGGSRPIHNIKVTSAKSKAKMKSAGGSGAGGMGGPGASNSGGSGNNPERAGFNAEGDCNCNSNDGLASGQPRTSARSSGMLDDETASDDKVPPDATDAQARTEPSNQRKWVNRPNLKAPGTSGHRETKRFSIRPDAVAPGNGSGPRTVNPGGSKSDISRILAPALKGKGIKVDKMFEKKKMEAEAPPGWSESDMHKLKRKHGTTNAFKIAWSAYKKTQKEMAASGKKKL